LSLRTIAGLIEKQCPCPIAVFKFLSDPEYQ
jgi:hypothetical protein